MQDTPTVSATRAPICQDELPIRPWAEEKTRRLPGLNPIEPGDWLRVDEAFAGQMAYREELIAHRRAAVLAETPGARPAALELLDAVLSEIAEKPGYAVEAGRVRRPDGVWVTLDRNDPLATAGRLVQEDFALMEKPEESGEHILTAGVLCFPASWSLEQKVLRPLTGIHEPVDVYDEGIARRVQRLFDGLQVERPIWRANFLVYGDPELHQPRREENRRSRELGAERWIRVERQGLKRLPETRAVVFSIHTYVVPFARLSEEDRAALSSGVHAR